MPDVNMSVNLAGMTMKNPVVVASGTFGFGREYNQFFDLSELGGICAKGLTLHRREGNPAPRIAETPMGILNSVGLQNPGVDAFIEEELPFLRRFDTRVIANISGNTPEEYGIMCDKLSAAGVDMIALCRPFICEEDLVVRLLNGQERASCVSCSKCFVLGAKYRETGIRCKLHEQAKN